MTAHEVHVLRMAAGHDEEPNEEAEAGSRIKACESAEIQGINAMFRSYIEALNKSK